MAGKDVGFEWLADTAAFVPVLATHLYKDRCSDYVPIETEESDGDSPGRNKRDDDGVKLREMVLFVPGCGESRVQDLLETLKVDVMTFDKGTLDFFLTQETSRLAEYLRNIATATSVESTYLVVSFRGARFVKTIVESGGEFQMSRVWTDVDEGTKQGQKHTCVAFTRLCRSAGIFNDTGSNSSLRAAEAHEHAQKLHKIIDQHYKTGPGRMKKPEMLRVRTSQTDGREERAECQDADAAPLKMKLPDENAGKAKDEAGTSTEQQNEQKQLSLEEAYDAAIGEGLRAEYPFAYFLEDLRATQPAAADRGRLTQEGLDQFVEENM
eukprot:g3661.t1